MERFIKKKINFKIPLDILDDLESRFLSNIRVDERVDIVKFFFNIERAHWYYLDVLCPNRNLIRCGIKQFADNVFAHVHFLRRYFDERNEIRTKFDLYKAIIPTYGAAIMSSNNMVLLVQHYWPENCWGFPKGKIEEKEDPLKCAKREFFEETGYDMTKSANPNIFIEGVWKGRKTRLYVIENVPMETRFAPRQLNEIKSCKWFRLDSLPSNINQDNFLSGNANFMIELLMRFRNANKLWKRDIGNSLMHQRKRKIEPTNNYTMLIRRKLDATKTDENYSGTMPQGKKENIYGTNKYTVLVRRQQ